MNNIKISVINLVEFIMKQGSIDNRYISLVKAIERFGGN